MSHFNSVSKELTQEHIERHEQEEELYEHHRVRVDAGQSSLRIDKYLMHRLPNTTRSKIQHAAKNGFVVVNGLSVKQNYKVKPHDDVSLVLPFPVRELELIPENIPLSIHYEDDDVIVVNKPEDMVVHQGVGNYRGTLVNALAYHIQNLPTQTHNQFQRPGLVHRLDKHTTGLMVVAKNEYAQSHLAKQFFEHTTQRRYHALVWGDVKENGIVVGHIGRSHNNRKVFTVFPNGDYGKHATTHYTVLERFGLVTLVECKLETGRTHQIRVHMKHIGHPLFHDLEYGGDTIVKGTTFAKYRAFIENCFALLKGQALHAKTLGFQHPTRGEYLQFESDLPPHFEQLLEKWRKYTQ